MMTFAIGSGNAARYAEYLKFVCYSPATRLLLVCYWAVAQCQSCL